MAEAAASEAVREGQERQTNKTGLTALPTELLLRIFNPLDYDTSTCLGLTCKRLWAIHEDEQEREERTQHRIDNGICSKRPFGKFSQLPFLLREWMGPNMVYVDMGFFKFIKKRRYCRMIKRHQIRWGQRKKQSISLELSSI
ncbi:hypothetical protein B0J14DRAFT_605119 [Halenospora varia]|nr:hypothetical protein B0J14DRAFT_605119 [Halenospora varia]